VMVPIGEVIQYISLILVAWIGWLHRTLARQGEDHRKLELTLAQNHPTKEDIKDLRSSIDELRRAIIEWSGNGINFSGSSRTQRNS